MQTTTPALTNTPGQAVEVSREEADDLGAFEEFALTEADAAGCADLPPEHWQDAATSEAG